MTTEGRVRARLSGCARNGGGRRGTLATAKIEFEFSSNSVRIQFEFELHFRRARWLVTRALLLTSFAPLAVASSGRARANQNTFASEGLVGTQSPCSPFGLRAEWREAVAGKNCTACTKHNFSVRGLMSASF